MKKDFNRVTTSDMPVDTSFTPPVEESKPKKTLAKAKINAIGKSTANKSKKPSTTKSGSKKTTTNKNVAETKKKSSTKEEELTVDDKLRSKLKNSDVESQDLDKLNEENIKNYSFKSKRNKVVIVLLAVSLVVVIAAIAIYLAITKLETNCNVHVHGVDATVYIDGDEISEFRAPSNLRGNSILSINLSLKINSGGKYNVKFIPKCFEKNVLMSNTLIYEHNTDLFYDGGDGYYYSIEPIDGNQRIFICGGVILDYEYKDTLNVENFKLEFHVYFEEV